MSDKVNVGIPCKFHVRPSYKSSVGPQLQKFGVGPKLQKFGVGSQLQLQIWGLNYESVKSLAYDLNYKIGAGPQFLISIQIWCKIYLTNSVQGINMLVQTATVVASHFRAHVTHGITVFTKRLTGAPGIKLEPEPSTGEWRNTAKIPNQLWVKVSTNIGKVPFEGNVLKQFWKKIWCVPYGLIVTDRKGR